jgi:uncharacterized protein YjiK
MTMHFLNLRRNYLIWFFSIIKYSCFFAVISPFTFCNSRVPDRSGEEQKDLPLSYIGSTKYVASDTSRYKVTVPSPSYSSFQYNLEKPDEKIILPGNLKEISGVAYYDENKIVCVQDENGDIYVLSLLSKEVVNKYIFGKDGDYEDIAVVGKTIYVIRSDGKIFRIENIDKENSKAEEFKTPFSGTNNTEGMAYDKSSNSLLIACKGSPAVDNDFPYKGYRAIYNFEIGEMKLNKKPQFLINLDKPDCYKNEGLFEEFSMSKSGKHKQVKSEDRFQPSGIAINPVKDEVWVISSVGKVLIILDRQGKILDLHHLDPEIFIQPEGICFSPSGDLFISSEGAGGKGYILRFNLLQGR